MRDLYRPFALVQRVDFLRHVCRDRDVLHLGCTNWPYREQSQGDDRFVHFALLETAKAVCGLDSDEEGLSALREQGVGHLFRGDLESLHAAPIDKTFDVIVAGEVIEHLSNPGLFLKGVQRFMRADTQLVLTTVNAYCGFRSAIYGLRGRGGRQEPVHPDHVAYYSRSTLNVLMQRAGLSEELFMFYDIGREHRPHNRWYINIINDTIVALMPQLADGVILVCKRGKEQS